MKDYNGIALMFKALSDPNRLMIVDILSCGELCACKILDKFRISQPTLSHHMQILCQAGLVVGRKDGKWMHYTLVPEKFAEMAALITELSSYKPDCICRDDTCGR